VKYHVANALQKLSLSRRADLRQWTGVRRDSNLFKKGSAREPPRSEVVVAPLPPVHVAHDLLERFQEGTITAS